MQQIQHVHIKPPLRHDPDVHRLDLEPSLDEDFDLDKLRSSLERFYATFIIGFGRAFVEVQRIRQWEGDGRRTAVTLLVSLSLVSICLFRGDIEHAGLLSRLELRFYHLHLPPLSLYHRPLANIP